MTKEFSLTTWNVNSVRAHLDHVLTYLSDHDPDIVCLQETKVEDKLFPRVPFMELGYHVELYGDKGGYAGVATLSKDKPAVVVRGFRDAPLDKHCRILMTEILDIRIYNLYVPNGTKLESEAFVYKIEWLGRLRAELDKYENPNAAIILCGDFNVAPSEQDVFDPQQMAGRLHFSPMEHQALAHLIEFGLQDCFRMHPDSDQPFTWFDYRNSSFQRGDGMRIDHIYATPSLAEKCLGVRHDTEPREWESPSDHLPVTGRFGLP